MSDDSIDENGQGLPETLPLDEKVLWQGSPQWKQFAVSVFHLRKVALYFAVILFIQVGYTLTSQQTITEVITAAAGLVLSAFVAIALLTVIGWLMARSALYTITNKRLVMSVGAALSIDINIPFQHISSAAVKLNNDGSGDIPISVSKEQPVSYMLMWPHVRPWQFKRPQAMLRGISAATEVAEILSQALQEDAATIVNKGNLKLVETTQVVADDTQTQAALLA